jgi:hypothetical protein
VPYPPTRGRIVGSIWGSGLPVAGLLGLFGVPGFGGIAGLPLGFSGLGTQRTVEGAGRGLLVWAGLGPPLRDGRGTFYYATVALVWVRLALCCLFL